MHTFYVPIPEIVQTNMSIFLISLILVWSQMSGVYVVALFVDGKNENKSTVNNGSCRSCFCEPVASNCKEEICTDQKNINLCKNKTDQANTEHQATSSTYNLQYIGFIFKMCICMCIMYMFIIHASGDCFDSISTRRIRPSLNRMLSDDGLPNTYSDDRSCVVPLNVSEYNNTNDPPPSYHDVQNTRTDFSSLRYSTRSPVQSADLNHDGSYNNYNASLFLTSPVDDEPPPSYDDFMAIYHSKLTKVHDDLPPNYANDRLYTAMPVDTMESARDLRTTFIVSETDILCAQV